MEFVIVGDIGGTNARFKVFSLENQNLCPFKEESFLCQDFENFDRLLEKITFQLNRVKIAVFAVAGPVVDDETSFTNNDWSPKTSSCLHIQEKFSIEKAVFLNDFEAAGYGCLDLPEADIHQINPEASVQGHGCKVVLGPGTGYGEAFISYSDHSYICWAGEGGAVDFAPHNQEEWEISSFLKEIIYINDEFEQFRPCGTANYEMCLGGIGAIFLYDFFKDKYPELVNQQFDDIWKDGPENRMKYLMTFGLGKKDLICEKAVNVWINVLGHAIGNSIAQYRPKGGVYVIGGVISKNFEKLVERKDEIFKAVCSKPRHVREDVISHVPIYLVKFYEVGVHGSLWYAKKILGLIN
jgi:glucokinase